jgi:hypothetical protein
VLGRGGEQREAADLLWSPVVPSMPVPDTQSGLEEEGGPQEQTCFSKGWWGRTQAPFC